MNKFFVSLLFVMLIAVVLALCSTSIVQAANCAVIQLPGHTCGAGIDGDVPADVCLAPENFAQQNLGSATVSVIAGQGTLWCNPDLFHFTQLHAGVGIPISLGQTVPFDQSLLGVNGAACVGDGAPKTVFVCQGDYIPTQDTPTQTSGATFQ